MKGVLIIMTTAYKVSNRYQKHEDFKPSASCNSRTTQRQLAKELGVSASYLSQIKNGKCAASDKVLNLLREKNQSGYAQKNGGPLWTRTTDPSLIRTVL